MHYCLIDLFPLTDSHSDSHLFCLFAHSLKPWKEREPLQLNGSKQKIIQVAEDNCLMNQHSTFPLETPYQDTGTL